MARLTEGICHKVALDSLELTLFFFSEYLDHIEACLTV